MFLCNDTVLNRSTNKTYLNGGTMQHQWLRVLVCVFVYVCVCMCVCACVCVCGGVGVGGWRGRVGSRRQVKASIRTHTAMLFLSHPINVKS